MKINELIEILKRLYREYVRKFLNKIILALILSVFVAGSTSATAWLLDPAVKKIFLEQNTTLAWLIPLGIIVAFSTKGMSLYFARSIILKIGYKISGELQKQIANNILLSDIQTLDNRHSGKYISNITFDAAQVQQLVSAGVLNIMKDTLTAIALIGLMFYQNWSLAIYALLMMPLAAFLAKSLGKRIGKATGEVSVLSGNLTSFLSEVFKGSKIIRIYQKEFEESKRANSIIDELLNKGIKIGTVMIRATPIMEILTGFMIAGFIFFSGKLISSGELGINNFFSFLAAMMLAYQPIRSLATINMIAYQGCAAAKRIFAVIDKPIEIKNDESLSDLNVNKCNIMFNNVDFKYLSTSKAAINNINLDIKGGEMTAFVGHSGAGKSTIINLLPRFYDPQKGEISIDNQNVQKSKTNLTKKNISLVSQDVILFDDTIKENILYAQKESSLEELKNACKFAAADEFISKLPDGYNTIIGENGVSYQEVKKKKFLLLEQF